MAVVITYNGNNPFLSRSPSGVEVDVVFEDNNGYISEIDRYTITGTRPRPSCNATFSDYKQDMDVLLDAFRLQFKTFSITENGNPIFSHNSAIVRSVTFPETAFKSFYRYEIVIDCYKSYKGLGIEQPEETYETSQSDSGLTTITHTISCQGVGPNGVENAKSFINSRKDILIPQSYAESPAIYPAILNRTYSINRLTGLVSLTTAYIYDEDDNISQYCTMTYVVELQEKEDGNTITIRGSFQGNNVEGNNEMTKARTRFDLTDWQAIAQREWEFFGGTSLLGEHVQFSVVESPLAGTMEFTAVWDTNSKEGVYIQETWSVVRNYEGEPTCFNYTGVVKTDFGCVGQRYAAVKALAQATNWPNRVGILWSQYGTGESLSTIAQSQSITESPFGGTVTVELTYCHDPALSCGCAEKLDYNLSFIEPIEQYVPQPVLMGRGLYIAQDMGYKNRRKFTIQGSARKASCCTVEQAKSYLKTRLNFLSSYYFNYPDKILENAEMDYSEFGDEISFNFTWNAAA